MRAVTPAMAKASGQKKSGEISRRLSELADFIGTVAELARRSGVKDATIRNAIKKGGAISSESLRLVALGSGCSAHWLLHGTGEMFASESAPNSIPVLATASGADFSGVCSISTDSEQFDESETLPGDLHLVRVHGNSMSNVAHDGQHVFCTHEQPKNGDLAVIETVDDELMFKRLYFTDDHVLCISVNVDPRYRPILLKKSQVRRMRKVWGVKF